MWIPILFTKCLNKNLHRKLTKIQKWTKNFIHKNLNNVKKKEKNSSILEKNNGRYSILSPSLNYKQALIIIYYIATPTYVLRLFYLISDCSTDKKTLWGH